MSVKQTISGSRSSEFAGVSVKQASLKIRSLRTEKRRGETELSHSSLTKQKTGPREQGSAGPGGSVHDEF